MQTQLTKEDRIIINSWLALPTGNILEGMMQGDRIDASIMSNAQTFVHLKREWYGKGSDVRGSRQWSAEKNI